MSDLLGQVDVVFVLDTTGSMGPYLEEAKRSVRAEVEKVAAAGDLDLRYAVIEYRDHPPQDNSFVTRVHPFGDGAALDRVLGTLRADGGGDRAEAVWDGLVSASKLGWRETADRMVFLIGDSPPHVDDCPCGSTGGTVVESLGRARLYAISIAGYVDTTEAFRSVAEPLGGNVTVVGTPVEMTASTSASMGSTSDLIGMSRSFMTASASLAAEGKPVSDEAVASSLGWTVDMAEGTRTYIERRGLKPEDKGS